MRSHLDCGDMIYPKFDPDMQLKLEQTLCKAVLAVTGVAKGTGRQRLLEGIGLETLYEIMPLKCV